MKYINKSGEDVQISIPRSNPVEWIVIKKGETKDLPISESRAALNGLYTEEKLSEMNKEAKEEDEKKVEAEVSSIGHKKIETKQIAEPKGAKANVDGKDMRYDEDKKEWKGEKPSKKKSKSSKKKSKK